MLSWVVAMTCSSAWSTGRASLLSSLGGGGELLVYRRGFVHSCFLGVGGDGRGDGVAPGIDVWDCWSFVRDRCFIALDLIS